MDTPRASSRLLEACNTCRKRKVKCDRQRPSCSTCSKSRMDCSYTDRIKVLKGPRRRVTRAKQFEDRLEKVESLLKLPVAVLERIAKETSGSTIGADPPSSSVSKEDETSVMNSTPPQQPIDGATQALKEITIDPRVKNFVGAENVPSTTAGHFVQLKDSLADSTEDVGGIRRTKSLNDVNSVRVFQSLPPKDEALYLLDLYFDRFNSVSPILHRPTFMNCIQEHYSTEYRGDLAWWGSLNIALAQGSRIHSLFAGDEEEEESWGYLENALAVVPALAVRTPSLSSIQALISMAMFLQATPVPRSYSLLVATAIRMGQILGLHRQESYSGMEISEIEQRKRIFWLGYILDKDISMRSGQPPVQHDDDVDVELPEYNTNDGTGYIFLSDGLWPMNFPRLRIQLAVIQGAIHRDLYSAKAMKQPSSVRCAAIKELDSQLRHWKDSTALDFEPEYLTKMLQDPFDILNIVVLYFTYFNCLTLIHRSSFQNMSWKTRSPDSIEPFNPRNFSSKPIVIETARSALRLRKLVPWSNCSCIWFTLQFSCSAIITVLRNVHVNPSLPTAVADYELVEPMLEMFCQLASRHVYRCTKHAAKQEPPMEKHQVVQLTIKESPVILELMRMRDFCFMLKYRAKAALDKAASNRTVGIGAVNDSSGNTNMTNCGINEDSLSQPLPKNYLNGVSGSHEDKPQDSYLEAFESSFPPILAANVVPSHVEPLPLEMDFTPDQARETNQSYIEELSHAVFVADKNPAGENISGGLAFNPQDVSMQEEPGLWNWWDMIEMDIDGNKAQT